MKKVISLVLAAVMLLSVFAVLPSASAAETTYKAGTVVQVNWKFPNVGTFQGFESEIHFGSSLELDESSINHPDINNIYAMNVIDNTIYLAIANFSSFDISSDHVMFSANFTVKEDVEAIDITSNIITEPYNMSEVDYITPIYIDSTNEFEVVVLSAPSDETEDSAKTVYFVKPENWNQNVYAYVWNSETNAKISEWPGEAFTKTELTDPNGDAVYSYTFTGDYDKIIFSDGTNQTGDMLVSEGIDKYYCNGVWYDSLDAIPVAVAPVVSLMGQMTDWETGKVMTAADGIYTTTLELEAGTYQFKIKENDTWLSNNGTIVDTTAGADNGWEMVEDATNCTLQATGGVYTFNYNAKTNMLIVLAEIVEQPTEESTEEPTEEPSEAPTQDPTPVENRTIYFVPNDEWKTDGAGFAAYVFGAGEGWIAFTDENGDGIYQGEVPTTYPNIIFVRMNPSASIGWEAKWNQTADLTIPTDGSNMFTVNAGEWNDVNGVWSVYSPATEAPTDEPTEEPTEAPSATLKNGIYEEDGALYYYKDGARFYAGLIMIDGYYYYVNSSCKVIAGIAYYISKTNYLLPSASYTFDEQGRMVNPPVVDESESAGDSDVKNGIYEEDGALYYYKDGARYYAGLIKINGYYYYVNSSCKVVAGVTYFISKTNTLLPAAAYKFGLDGRMLNPPEEETGSTEGDGVKNGFVKEEDGCTYYYVDGVKTYAGLIEVDGDYYYVKSSCKVITGMAYYVSKTNGYVDPGTYYFDNDGKMIK